MKIGILGSGKVAQSLANGFLALGHEVTLGSRCAGSPAASQRSEGAGPAGHAGTFEQAAGSGELLVLATLGTATPQAIEMAGPRHFDGKLVWDVTNALDFLGGNAPQARGSVWQFGRGDPSANVARVEGREGLQHRRARALLPPQAPGRPAR